MSGSTTVQQLLPHSSFSDDDSAQRRGRVSMLFLPLTKLPIIPISTAPTQPSPIAWRERVCSQWGRRGSLDLTC